MIRLFAGPLTVLLVSTSALGGVIPPNSQQALVVKQGQGAVFSATIELQEREANGAWKTIAGPFNAVIGRNGFAPAGEKREGDGKTPTGVFPLGTAFGYDKTARLKMPYRQATDQDFWVDDSSSPQYNQWVTGMPQAKSWEVMHRADDLYSLGAVVEYNTHPIVPGNGSAIFLHIWRSAERPTAGCVALEKAGLTTLLSQINPDLNPVVMLNP